MSLRVFNKIAFEEALGRIKLGCTASRAAWHQEDSPQIPVVLLAFNPRDAPVLVVTRPDLGPDTVEPFKPSSDDLLAEDWFLLDYPTTKLLD